MGAFTSRHNHGVEEVDISANNAYRYPPKSGCYFGSHFIMGGDRFETTQPEAYLFGENQDLNFLGNRPIPFPYPAPQAHEPTKTLKSLVNIRKDSVRFIKAQDEDKPTKQEEPASDEPSQKAETADSDRRSVSRGSIDSTQSHSQKPGDKPTTTDAAPPPDEEEPALTKYNIDFTFDTDVKCAITVYYFATEEISNKQAIYRPRDPSMNSETFHYKRGANQVFSQTTHIIDPSKFPEEEWQFNPDKEVIPVVIQCVVEEEEYLGHSHMTFCIVEKVDGGFVLKPLKQKQMVDGLCYLLQEIYGIENKNNDRPKDEDLEDNGSECVICLVEMRDTLILPCRHLCLCNCCADNLRYQASNCPICRSPFRALLQIRAMRKKTTSLPLPSQTPPSDSSDETPSQEGVPPGYEAVSLIEALNGPSTPSQTPANNQPRSYPDATSRSNRSSHPSSPESSPLVGRRKNRRKASVGSNYSRNSIQGSVPIEEAQEMTEDVTSEENERLSTPEVILSEVPEPSKSPNKSKKSSKSHTRYPSKKSALNEPLSDDYETIPADNDEPLYEQVAVSIVNETAPPIKKASPVAELLPDDNEEDCPDEVNPEDINDVEFKPSRNSLVLSDGDGDHSDSGLSPGGVDPMLSKNPDGSGSSFSSTESTKGLLAQQNLGSSGDKEDDKVDPVLA